MKNNRSRKYHNYLPDGRITKRDMFDYGYCWGGMYPVQKDAAVKYFGKLAILKLYPDGAEAYVEDFDDLQNHEGLFGIEKDCWIKSLKDEMENHLKDWKLDTAWNGFDKGTQFETIARWFEKRFEQPYHLNTDLTESEAPPLRLDILNRNFEPMQIMDFLMIPLKLNESLMYRLLFNILDRTVEEGEHWKFYFLRFPKNVPSAQNKILAINQMKVGSDNITAVHNIIDGCEPEAYAFVTQYRLDDVYYKMLKAGKQGCY